MDFRPVLYVTGTLLCVLAFSMVLPMLVDLYDGSPDWKVFFLGMVITAFFGGSLILSNTGQRFFLNTRQAFTLTAASWLAIALFGALPFYFSELKMNFTDAFFESMSGITTTGATVLTGLDTAPKGILIWRAMLQWLGGIGFIVMAMSILPFLKVGGMRLFRTESSESEKALPRATQLASSIGLIYLSLTIMCTVCYIFGGLRPFDALAHAMTTLSTGGFSTFDSSMQAFEGPWIEIVAIVFMALGGLPFVLYIKALNGDVISLIKDTQVQWFLGFVAVCSLALLGYLILSYDLGFFNALLWSVFNVISIVTTTGFVSHDYATWGSFAFALFFFLTFVGACAGSTAGGIKIFRAQVLFSVVRVQIKKLLHPSGVFIPHYNRHPLPEDVPMSVMGFFFVYALTFVMGTIALAFMGLDFTTALSGSATAISNVGPGLGEIIGPTGTFKTLPEGAKWVLSSLMLLGRLELFTILVIFTPNFWRN